MCRNIRQELDDLNLQACGSLTDAQAQRLIHQTLFDAMRRTGRPGHPWTEYDAACAAWDSHIKEHETQAAAIRQGRAK